MNADLLRLSFTYIVALLILIGGFVLLVIPSQVDQGSLLPFVTGMFGVVLGFVFNRESTTAGQRSAERAINQGANAGVIPAPPPAPPA